MSTEQLVLQYGMAGAVLAAIALFLKFLKDDRQDRQRERQEITIDRAEERKWALEERTRFLDVLEQYRGLLDNVIDHCPTVMKKKSENHQG